MNSKAPGPSSKSDNEGEESFKRTGSFRKILPGTSSGDSQLNTSVKMIDRPNVAQNNMDYAVYLREYSILSEYKLMQTQDLKGIYVIPSAQNPFLWFGVLFVRQGIYQGGVFRFTITLPDIFPDGDCPKVIFKTKVFHPLIHNETGEFSTSAGFPEWKKSNRVFHLVQFITKVFNKVDPKLKAINEEASNLFENNIEEYRTKAKESVKDSLDHVYDPPETEDAHYLKFSPWDPEIHEPIRQKLYQSRQQQPLDPEKSPRGYSWVQPGSLKPLSKSEEDLR
ncbi:protein crossbronx homolog isoform X1 [Microplitis mediator]|uniref:protein crossbronx homolog isoform X1 n=1 Tax=Microplitis mediator TaxID=375433 RepID=UPI0025538C33|nr:protein crossbronx homolog isoform X1 [Microplitis mediator]